MASPRLLANGVGTDHPVPGLPFVDDTHLPAVPPPDSATARIAEPDRAGLVWIVHTHPHLGRTVLLYDAGPDGTGPWNWQADQPLVTRTGGYWWDGARWHRPPLLWDEAAGAFEQQIVPAAATVTVADLLDDPLADASRGQLQQVTALAEENAATEQPQWLNDLARWAAHRSIAPGRPPLDRCVVTLTAPELAGDQLIDTTALAAAAAISPSALRAYISRGQGAVPEPQGLVAGRPMWSRPVAENWAAHRRRPAATRWPAHRSRRALPEGAEQIRQRLDPILFAALWEDPERRARWVLRHRTQDAVRHVAADLAHLAAERLQDTVPAQALAKVLTQAALADFAAGAVRSTSASQVLGWLTLYHPHVAEQALTTIAEQTELHFGIPRADTELLLRADPSVALPGPEEIRRPAA